MSDENRGLRTGDDGMDSWASKQGSSSGAYYTMCSAKRKGELRGVAKPIPDLR